MRVLLCDPLNTQNNLYVLAKRLRRSGIDASLAIAEGSVIPQEHLPEWHDASVGYPRNSPAWLHRLNMPLVMPFLHPIEYLTRWMALVKLTRKYDLIVCSGYAPIWIHWARKPFIFVSYGSDLDQEAVRGWSGNPRKDFTWWQKLLHRVVKSQMVLSLKKAKATVVSPYQIGTAQRLGLKNLHFLPHIIDTELFCPMDMAERQAEKERIRQSLGCEFLLFHPSRQVWTDSTITDCKGNDRVFRVFAAFLKSYPKRAKLLVVEKGWDVEASKNLIDRLGIVDHVLWMKPMPKVEMCYLYNVADVVLDQFSIGVLTLVSVEAMACGAPVMTYVAPAPDGMFYPEMPPVNNEKRESYLCRDLLVLANNETARGQLGRDGRTWAEKYCLPDKVIPKYIELLEKIGGSSAKAT